MEIGKHGLWFFLDGMTAPQSAEFARKVEKLGYSALWIPEAVGREPFAHAGYLAAKTDKQNIAPTANQARFLLPDLPPPRPRARE